MNRKTFLRGFTMIELLVVIVVVGILAAALAPTVGKFLTAGDDAVSRNNLMRLGKAAIAYRSEHDNCYPAAGGCFTTFQWRDPEEPTRKEKRYGRAAGWVYFEHSCPRNKGDDAAAGKIGDGNGDGYDLGGLAQSDEGDSVAKDTYVNEDGCCTCFDSKSNQGGLSPKPAGWYDRQNSDMWSQAQVAIMNGCLFSYLGGDLTAYTSPAFNRVAAERLGVPKSAIIRAYAMNVVTGADKDLYDTRSGYSGAGAWHSGRGAGAGQSALRPYEDTSARAEAMAARLALFVELDVDNTALKSANGLEGDQVWDWDNGDESMGFVHENNGMMYAHVCFADGHVEAIRDPSTDITNPDTQRRVKLSKWYGSGGVNGSGEKLD